MSSKNITVPVLNWKDEQFDVTFLVEESEGSEGSGIAPRVVKMTDVIMHGEMGLYSFPHIIVDAMFDLTSFGVGELAYNKAIETAADNFYLN